MQGLLYISKKYPFYNMVTNTVPIIFNVLSIINEWYRIKRRINEWCRIARVGAPEFHQPTNVTNQPAKMATHAVSNYVT